MAVVDGLDLSSVGNFIDHVLLELDTQHETRLRDAEAQLARLEARGKIPSDWRPTGTSKATKVEKIAADAYQTGAARKDIDALRRLMQQRPKDAALHKAIYLMMFVAGHSGDRMKELFTERGHLVGQAKGGQAKGRSQRARREKRWLRPLLKRALEIRAKNPKKWQVGQTLARETVAQFATDPRLCERLFGTPKLDSTSWIIRVLATEVRRVDSGALSESMTQAGLSPLHADHDGDLQWRLWIAMRELWHDGVITRSAAPRNRRRV